MTSLLLGDEKKVGGGGGGCRPDDKVERGIHCGFNDVVVVGSGRFPVHEPTALRLERILMTCRQ